MNRSMPDLPVHHQLPEFTQTHVHRVSNAIQQSHPLSSPSSLAPNPSQHQSLFQWVNSSQRVAKVQEFQLQHHSFQRNPRADLLQNGLVGYPWSPRDTSWWGGIPVLVTPLHLEAEIPNGCILLHVHCTSIEVTMHSHSWGCTIGYSFRVAL